MALRSLVKISSVNNLNDARYAAGMGVELMGFDLEESSENYISPETFAAITSWVSGVKFVGEIQVADQEQSLKLLEDYKLDYLQISNPAAALSIIQWPIPIIVKIEEQDRAYIADILQEFAKKVVWFLIEPTELLNAELMEWCIQQSKEFPIIIGSNVTAKNVLDILDSGFSGVALSGGNEIKPGYKDFDELADILEVLELEN